MILENKTVVENGIIPIYQSENEENMVDARTLHAELGISKDFSTWIKAQIKGLFLVENIDFTSLPPKGGKPLGGRPENDYLLTLDAAKHIALASRTEKGKQVREYFINFEKKAKELIKNELLRLRESSVSIEEFQLVQTRRRLIEVKNRREELNRELNNLEYEFNNIMGISPATIAEPNNKLFYFLFENQDKWYTKTMLRKEGLASNRDFAKWLEVNVEECRKLAAERDLVLLEDNFARNIGCKYQLTQRKARV